MLLALATLAGLQAQSTYATPYTFGTFAGSATSFGSTDSTGGAARFRFPLGVAVDSSGNIYIADTDNHTIRKVTSDGVVTTFAGLAGSSNWIDGTGSAARFSSPSGVAVDSAGNVYVADTGNNTIRKITSAGVVTTLAGTVGNFGSVDGTGTAAQINEPFGMAVDSAGNLYVSDRYHHTIRKITNAGVVTTLAGSAGSAGSTDGTGSAAQFTNPEAVAVDSAGNVYVADTGNHLIRKITNAGVVTTLAGTAASAGSADGTGTAAKFNYPTGVSVDSVGTVYVADMGNHLIRKITSIGVVTTLAGAAGSTGTTDGTASSARFTTPRGVAVDSAGHLYVVGYGSHAIRRGELAYTFGTLAGLSGATGSTDATGSAARFSSPTGVAVDSAGNVYVADRANHRIRKTTSGGVVTTLAGSTAGYQDATGTAAQFNAPSNVAVDSTGNVYVADRDNHRIRKITSGGVVTTLAGSGTAGTADGTGTAAQFDTPSGVAVDSAGNVFVADYNNSTIRKITSGGVVTTLAGLALNLGSADGTGSSARFNYPFGIAVDSAGNVFVSDSDNHTIRKITSGGVVTTLAGSAGNTGTTDGTGSVARFNLPAGIAVDGAGTIYVADLGSHTIRKISSGGMVTTLGGLGGNANSVDGTGPTARFFSPSGVAVDSTGNLYVADRDNYTVRWGVRVPSQTSAPTAVGTANVNFNFTVTFSGEPTGFTASGLPAGLAIDSATGVISGTPTATGTSVVTLGATNLAGSATGTLTITLEPPYTFATLAGSGTPGSVDGPALTATFSFPRGIAVDSAGNVYVSDASAHVIRKITNSNMVTTLAGLAENSGTTDGIGSAARFYGPRRLAVDSAGNIYVADSENHRIRKITSEGSVTTLAGSGTPGSADGTGAAAQFNFPVGVAVDSADNVYVSDASNHTIRKVTSGGVVTTLAGSAANSGSADGTGAVARFSAPLGISVDSAGNVYVADSSNHTIRKVTSGGVTTTVAGSAGNSGSADGTGAAARFSTPADVAVDSAGDLYVADLSNDSIRKITGGGVTTTLAGLAGSSSFANGTGSAARFGFPIAIAVDSAGNLYVADESNIRIRWGAVSVPALTSATTGGGTVGMSFNYTATFSGSLTGFTASGLPAGLAINTTTGVISGTPTAAGTSVVTLGATNGAGAATGTLTITIETPYTFTTLAGLAGNSGSTDGTGDVARFNNPEGMAVDNAGNIFVADYANHLIRKITSAGVVTTFAGLAGNSGATDGTGSSARFNGPSGVAVDNAGNVYVADYLNHLIRKITSAGVVTTFAGLAGNSGAIDGTGSSARFNRPAGIAVDSAGNVFVAEYANHLIRKITSAGVVTTLAGLAGNSGSADGTGSSARFNSPFGIAVDSTGNVYVADFGNHVIRKITSAGVVTTPAGLAGNSGSADGTSSAARFNYPVGVAVDNAGNVFIADRSNHTIRKITSAGVVTTLAGLVGNSGSADGTGSSARFYLPWGLAVDNAGNLYVASYNSHTIRWGSLSAPSQSSAPTAGGTVGMSFNYTATFSGALTGFTASGLPAGLAIDAATGVISGSPTATGTSVVTLGASNPAGDGTGTLTITVETPYTFTTLAGLAGNSGSTDGTGSVARFYFPEGVAVDSAGTVYVADQYNHTIRKITGGGVVTTLAGAAGSAGSTDGTGSAARFNTPRGIAVDGAGNLYVADFYNRTIRKITPDGVVTTLAGLAGISGSVDGTGATARFDGPISVAVDSAGEIYVADSYNHTIRKITSAGVVTTLAGTAGISGSADGTGSAARFNNPSGVAVDSSFNVYVADANNHTIRKVTSGGVVTTLAGLAGSSGNADGAGSAARFFLPWGVAVDGAGNIYVGTNGNQTIRKITPAGVVSKLAGSSGIIGSTDGTGVVARFYFPHGVAVDSAGNIYVADTSNQTIRWGALTVPALTSATTASGTVGLSFTYTATFSGALTGFTASGLPAGLSINAATGVISGTPTAAGTFPVTLGATNGAGAATGTLTLTIAKASGTVTLGSLSATYDGAVHAATATTSPGSLTVSFTYDASSTAPTNAGTYAVVGTINDANYQGSASGSLVISKATAPVTLGSLTATYNGTTHAATAITTPGSLTIAFTYNGSGTAPTNASTYAVVGTIIDANYQGSASGTLVISKATPLITWATPAGIDYGTPISSTQLNATANVPGSFSYSPSSGNYPAPGTHTLTATFTPTDTANYQTATAQRSLVVTYQNDSRIPAGFDVQGYYARNLDVQAYYQSNLYGAWLHFYDYGLAEGRQFDTQFIVDEYLLLNSDLTNAFGSDRQAALMHWLTYGHPLEDRIGRVPVGFNIDDYLARYPDLAAAFGSITPRALRNVTVWNHYVDYGVREGRSDGDFEAYGYLAGNSDLAAVFGSDVEAAAWHWYFYGRREGRRIPGNFDVTGYRTRNPDVVVVWGNDKYGCWLHYRDVGVYENRVFDDLFRVFEYRARYSDVQAAYGNNLTGVLNHWLFYGKPEGRLGRNP